MKQKKAFIVLGLGYGDEGKGLVTDNLCLTNSKPLVIRFNGGQQAGHTVIDESGKRHIFSNFGSGTLRGASTFWSRYCTFSPPHFLEELKSLGETPIFYIDPNCNITTHYDILFNRTSEVSRGRNKHGSCGLGVGATIERNSHTNFKLTVQDIWSSDIEEKLKLIKEYYRERITFETIFDFEGFNHDIEDRQFLDDLNCLRQLVLDERVKIVTDKHLFSEDCWLTYVFEGAQGILLDKDYGDSPYVTKSNTTSKNALQLLKDCFDIDIQAEIFYVTRCYSTRHGAGPFTKTYPAPRLVNTHFESNKKNAYQGVFKITNLNVDKLNYALQCDHRYSESLVKNLVITCMDQLTTPDIPISIENTVVFVKIDELKDYLISQFKSIKLSYSPRSADILQLMPNKMNSIDTSYIL